MKAARLLSNCKMVRSRIGKCLGLAVHFENGALFTVEKVSDLCTVLVADTKVTVNGGGQKVLASKKKAFTMPRMYWLGVESGPLWVT